METVIGDGGGSGETYPSDVSSLKKRIATIESTRHRIFAKIYARLSVTMNTSRYSQNTIVGSCNHTDPALINDARNVWFSSS